MGRLLFLKKFCATGNFSAIRPSYWCTPKNKEDMKMKKLMIWLLIAALGLTGIALADGATHTDISTNTNLNHGNDKDETVIPPLQGTIQEIIDPQYDEEAEALLSATLTMETEEFGLVEVHFTEQTLLEGAEDFAVGDYIFVSYNGMMTRSLPPQVTAEKVTAYRFTGTVSQLQEDGFLLTTEEAGDVWVRALSEQLETVEDGQEVTVYFDGVMTMSLPGQINAAWIVTPVDAEA